MVTRIFSNVLMLSASVLLISCGTPLEDYQPKSAQEKEIKLLLLEFGKARNNYNIPGMVTLMSDDCKININTREITKSEFASNWKANDLESFGKCNFTNPEIDIKNDAAEAKLKVRQGILVTFVFNFKMRHQDNRWVISEWNVMQG